MSVLRLLVPHDSLSTIKVTSIWRSESFHLRFVADLARSYGAHIIPDGSGSLSTAAFRYRVHCVGLLPSTGSGQAPDDWAMLVNIVRRSLSRTDLVTDRLS